MPAGGHHHRHARHGRGLRPAPIEAEAVVEQARSVLEDLTIAAWKVGFLGSAETVSAVAEVLSDYPDVPLVTYLPHLSWLDEDQLQPYLDAFRELMLPPPKCWWATTRR
jgi:hydroxymethylpyrimidine/phosphomethylpyrimidine kinase